MDWFRRHREREPAKRSKEASDALKRAETSVEEATEELKEMRAHASKSRRRREENHFAPLIWKEFGGK